SQNKSYYNIEDLDVGFAIFELDKDHDFTELLNTRNRNFVRFHVDPADTPITSTVEIIRRVIETPKQLTP
ncbi:MAG: hypothetical protein KAV87_51640, partial [Desulfobacteraceae bacterium]|nr:hypothetical protein [Desulfobacteraceae bacterium]